MTISRETFDAWRAPRFGTENPTRLDNELWAALVRDHSNAWAVNKRFGYERAPGAGPTWCFDRFGQTTTLLDDGRTIYIAGEHEDYYDPDFWIYNDVVVVAPDATIAIYGYPRDAFPPTDFHTATFDAERIWIVGSLGYADARAVGTTQVCRLDLQTFAIERLATTGTSPGWIHKHEARLVDGSLVVRGGLVENGESLEENIDEWALQLATLCWTRRTAHDWQRWAVQRVDGGRSLMFELRQMQWSAEHPQYAGVGFGDGVMADLGRAPSIAVLERLYRFDGVGLLDARHDEHNVWRIVVDGVVVRFTEESHRIAAMVEGRLTEPRLRALQEHVLSQLYALYGCAWELASAPIGGCG